MFQKINRVLKFKFKFIVVGIECLRSEINKPFNCIQRTEKLFNY